MNTFTLPRECVLPVPPTAPQEGALPVCALVTPGLVGSTKRMSHCHVWVSVISIAHLISGGLGKELHKYCHNLLILNISSTVFVVHFVKYDVSIICYSCYAT